MIHKTLIIAEAGVNHNGNIKLAHQLIDAAVDAGADIIKFQTFTADAIVTKNLEKAVYQKDTTGEGGTQYEMIKKLELDRNAHLSLMKHCAKRDIEFLSAPFDHDSIDLLMEMGLKRFKIPSGEITNLPYLEHIGKCGKPIILSSGMSTIQEVRAALGILENAGTIREKITILHCNTEYPTLMADVNLMAMVTIWKKLGVQVGYSDHTLGIEVPVAAVALGASIIEKHFTLDRSLDGPDHKASLEPDELKAMVTAIRNIEYALGDGIKRASKSEIKNLPIVRKSIVATKTISTGEIFSARNVGVKRPGTGISPMRWYEVIGKYAVRDFQPGELIEI